MSVIQCTNEFGHFLLSKQPQVIVVAGKWGVGKTYAWNAALTKAVLEKSILFSRYCYVSLFGLSSLNEIKDALVFCAKPTSEIDQAASFDSFKTAIQYAQSNWRKTGFWAKAVPMSESYGVLAAKIGYFALRDHIICIDDIERRNDTLALKEILGLVSQLKEEKNCKVVLLLNDEQLGGSSKEFQAYLEKVADVFIRFEPTPFEAARIALDGSMTYHSKLEELCIRLGLVNIRTIQKIDGTLRRISAELVGIDQRVIEQAAHSTTLFWFSQLHPEDAPTIDYIRSTNIWEEILAKDDKPVTHPEWRALLTSYEFADLDEFDILLLDGIQRGHFDFTALKSQALRQADLLSLRDEDDSFSQAWRLYHDSFDDNSDQVMTKLAEAVIKTPRVVSATNLSGTVGLLRDLNWQGNIKNLIETYVNGRDDSLDFWDLSRHPFGGDVKDQDVVEAFRKKRNSFPDKKDFARILIKWGEKSGYNNDDISFIASHSEHDFHALFRRLRGTELRRAIEGSLWFKESNEREEMVIVAAATSALRKIASESAINRRRVLRYQISLD